MVNIFFKKLFTKNDLGYKYFINLVEVIIKYQKLCLIFKELLALARHVNVKENYRGPELFSPLTGKTFL